MKIPTYEEIFTVNQRASVLEETINRHLISKEYDQIFSLLSLEDNRAIAGSNQRIYILYMMFHLMALEIESSGTTSLEGKSVSQIIRHYQILTLYLRRIEFDFPNNLQIEIMEYLSQEKIGLKIVVGIVNKNDVIIQKQKVINRLTEIVGNYYE